MAVDNYVIGLAVVIPFLLLLCVIVCYCGLCAAMFSAAVEDDRRAHDPPTVVVHMDEKKQGAPLKSVDASEGNKEYYSKALKDERGKTEALETRLEWLEKANKIQGNYKDKPSPKPSPDSLETEK